MSDLDAQLRSLAEKGARAQREESGLNWDAALPRQLPWQRPIARGIVNQFVGGEEATARLCRRVLPRIASAAARDCLLVQVEDERRHAETYRHYLTRLGGEATRHDFLDEAVERCLAWSGAPEAALLAFHVIVEGEALAFQDTARNWIRDPLFDEMSRQIARDEARHVAFGRLYLSHALPQLPLQERIEIYRWLRALWFEGTNRLAGGHLGPVIASRLPKRWMAARWQHWNSALRAAGLFDGADESEFTAA